MATAGAITDRVYREWLHRPDDSPVHTTLSGDVAAMASTFTYNKAALTTEEQALLSIGQLVEIDQELVSVVSSDLAAGTFVATRGFHGTVDVAHSSGAVVYIAPSFPRRVVFDAVADAIVDLYPDLWHTNTISETVNRNWIEVPAATTGVIRARSLFGTDWVDVGTRFLKEFPDAQSNTAVQFPDWPASGRVILTLKQKFARPSVETTEVSDIEEDWEQLVVLGAVVNVFASTDVDAVRSDFVTETFQAQTFPTGSGSRMAREAINRYEYKMDKAKRELAVRYPIPTVIRGVAYGAF